MPLYESLVLLDSDRELGALRVSMRQQIAKGSGYDAFSFPEPALSSSSGTGNSKFYCSYFTQLHVLMKSGTLRVPIHDIPTRFSRFSTTGQSERKPAVKRVCCGLNWFSG